MASNSFLPAVTDVAESGLVRASTAIRLSSVQSVRLRQSEDSTPPKGSAPTPFQKHRHVLQALAAWPANLTISLNLLTRPEPAFPLNGRVELAIVITATGEVRETVVADLLNRTANLYALLATYLDKAEFEMVTSESELVRWITPLQPTSVFRLDRYRESLALSVPEGTTPKKIRQVGFLTSSAGKEPQPNRQKRMDYLFPWFQDASCDLALVLEALLFHPAPVWMQVRLRPARATIDERSELERSLTVCEELLGRGSQAESILSLQTKALREALSDRLWQINQQVFLGSCFLCSESRIDDALATAVANEISSLPNVREQPHLPLKGGFTLTPVDGWHFLAPDSFSPNGVLTVDEAACAFRVPWPETIDPQGLTVKYHRTGLIAPALLQQQRADMLPLGTNRHRGHINEVLISDEDRMRHTLVMGQTGTGKSVFLEGLALSDISRKKGICFLDPHGDSIEKILQHYPEERIDDLIIIDFLNEERIIPFNLIAFNDEEERDRLIDDLYAWIDFEYDMKLTGGPMFESYFRTFLRLIMDDEVARKCTPTIHDFLRVFNDRSYRLYCRNRCSDPEVEQMVEQALEAGGEASLNNMAPYVTSKFNRFFTNRTVKIMTGQEENGLNFREIMDEGKVLLINLGKGRFGNATASLLASQIVSRIQIAAMNRIKSSASERRDFFLYVDEFQTVASEPFISMLSEARKFRLGLVLANQYADQLNTRRVGSDDSVLNALLGNVGNTTCFRLGINDAQTMASVFHPVFQRTDLTNLPVGCCYVNLKTNGANPCSFSLETRNVERLHRPGYVDRLREVGQRRHSIPREEARKNIIRHSWEVSQLCKHSND